VTTAMRRPEVRALRTEGDGLVMLDKDACMSRTRY